MKFLETFAGPLTIIFWGIAIIYESKTRKIYARQFEALCEEIHSSSDLLIALGALFAKTKPADVVAKPRDTFERMAGAFDRCANCGHREREHAWLCTECSEAIEWGEDGMPAELHVHGPRREQCAAALRCDMRGRN